MSYDLEKAKQFMEAMKENDEQIAQKLNEHTKRQLNITFGTRACYADTDMVYPHNPGALPRNSGRYPWNSDGTINGCVNQEVDIPCIDKEGYEMMMNDIVTLLKERYGIPHPKVRMKVGLHSDVIPAIDVDISKPKCTITKVIFNDPVTIVFWSDGTKTIVKCREADIYDKEKGLAMAISKKLWGNKGNYYEVFKKWIPELEPNNESDILSYDNMMKAAQLYSEQLAKEVKNAFNILRIKPSKEVEKND